MIQTIESIKTWRDMEQILHVLHVSCFISRFWPLQNVITHVEIHLYYVTDFNDFIIPEFELVEWRIKKFEMLPITLRNVLTLSDILNCPFLRNFKSDLFV